MPLQWTARPPVSLRLDRTSLPNYRIAEVRQTFYGVIEVFTGLVHLNAGTPRVGDAAFNPGAT